MVFLKKHYTFKPSEEWVFKPCLKMVKTANEFSPRSKSIKCFNQTFIQNKNRPERKHLWPFQEIEKENKGLDIRNRDNNSIIKEEMRNIGKAGFSRPNYDVKLKALGLTGTLPSLKNSKKYK